MNKGLAKGIAKISLIVFALALVGFFVLRYFSPVFAAHDANVTIYPNIANCNELGNTFTINVYNNGPDSLLQVEIYKALVGISDFECGPAPIGWTLFSYEDRCIYVTGLNSPYKIAPGSSLNFTFNATMNSSSCQSIFTVVTVDDHRPVGDRKTYDVTVLIDCKEPLIYKTVGEPKIPGTAWDWWVTSNTPINMFATDNKTTDQCNLGLDYCRWRVTLDGVVGDWNIVKDEYELQWVINLLNDSNHYLEVECYDIAKNKAVLNETDKVDNTPPVTTKQFNGPQHSADGVEWIDGTTTVTLNPTDPDLTGHQCNVGVEKTWYKNILGVNEEPCWDSSVCKALAEKMPYCSNCPEGEYPKECIDKVQNNCTEIYKPYTKDWYNCVQKNSQEECCGGWDWTIYTGDPIPKVEESCHVLYYFSIDELGNLEPIKTNCFFVDKTPPEVTKIVNQPKVEELDLERLGNGKADWVISQSYSGSSSVKLIIPDNAVGTDFAGVDSFFDVFVDLKDIASLSYYRKVVKFDKGWSPLVILGIDADGDGKFEANPLEWEASLSAGSPDPSLLGDDSFIQCEAKTGLTSPDLDWVYVDAYNTFKCYTPNVIGNGYESVYDYLVYFQKNNVGRIEPTDKVAMVKVELGGNPTTQENEIAYVDYVQMNGKIIIDEPEGLTWVSSKSDIVFTCTDQGPHPSGNEQICYKVSYDSLEKWDYITDKYCPHQLNEDGYCCEQATVSKPFTFNFKEETMHNLEYYCEDAVEKKSDVYIQFYKVDNTPPSITKTMIGEDHLGECPPGPSPKEPCYVKDDGKNGVHIDVSDGGEVCHVDKTQCTYELWWQTDLQTCIEEFNGTHLYNPDTGLCFVEGGEFGEEGKNVLFSEDSTHILKVNCKDALGNQMVEDVETFLVDSTPPITTKTYGNPHYPDPIVENQYPHWITSQTPITLTATDAKVGVHKIYYRFSLVNDNYCWDYSNCQSAIGSEDFLEYSTPFTISEDSCHLIEYYSVDKLGNEETVKKQCVFVDNTKPKTWVEVGEPKIPCDPEDPTGCDYWIRDHVTPIDIYCEDQGNHPVDNSHLYYRYKVDDGEWTNWIDPNGFEAHKKIIFEEDSVHYLQYYCVDALGNSDGTAEQPYEKVYKVDSTPPTVTKTVGEPKIQCIEENCDWWITQDTEITLTAEDGGKTCAVGGVKCYYRYGVDSQPAEIFFDDVESGADDWTATGLWHITEYRSYSPTHSWAYNEESDHNYDTGYENSGELISKDISLGSGISLLTFWSWEQTECGGYCGWDAREVYVNDGSGWVRVWYSTGPEDQWHKVTIDLSAYEGKTIKIKFRFDTIDSILNNYEGWYIDDIRVSTGVEWTEYTGPFKFKEDSVHYLEYFCVDALGNKGQIQTEIDKVDSTPPTTTKTYGQPFYTDGTHDWIAITTSVTLTAEDGGEICHIGSNFTKYRYCLYQGCYEEEPCSCPETPWLDYKEPFTIPNDSEHCIEFYSEDKLGNKETVKSQCVYVDNKAPVPIKTVGEPKAKWDGKDAKYYDIADKCWSPIPEQTIECWKVTLFTPITLDCKDEQPHPVGHEETCFKVEWDGNDTTEEYCRVVNGTYNKYEDGFCCGLSAPYEFHFNEETEHNLKYYCVDYLGNKGPIDEEKFKVEGTKFEIKINKKWNLISVPFVMLDNSIEEVFKDVKEDIISVWTYDSENNLWLVYSPDDGPDSLTEMVPGWGYWVLAKNDTMLVIGGSLFKPAVTPPDKKVVKGWNLIGYFGTENQTGYYGPFGNGKTAYCALYSLVDTTVGYPKWSALLTYWEPYNPYQWKYLNQWSKMDPGAGYWISMDENDTYTFSTTCYYW